MATPKKQKLVRDQIQVWKNRADTARQQVSPDLVDRAIEQVRRLENELAKLQEFELD